MSLLVQFSSRTGEKMVNYEEPGLRNDNTEPGDVTAPGVPACPLQ